MLFYVKKCIIKPRKRKNKLDEGEIMSELLNFFKNALKAIFFSPFYILYYLCALIVTIILYIYGEIISLFLFFSGSGYRQEKYNEYDQKLKKCKTYNATYDYIKEHNL